MNAKLPPPYMGSVHIKAAWIQLTEAEANSGRFHTVKDAAFYLTEGDTVTAYTSEYGFGLIGLHIIQRVHTSLTSKVGGTFIFATWEHVDNDSGFTYANYYTPDDDPDSTIAAANHEGFYPDVLDTTKYVPPYILTRRYQPISNPNRADPTALGTKQVNDAVHAAIQARDSTSVWLNYFLVGTQFQAINVGIETDIDPHDTTGVETANPNATRYPITDYDPTGIGQPVYMANLVIESNAGLQHFQGLPPGVVPIARIQGVGVVGNSTVNFNPNAKNLSFGRNPIRMGGCMGCHGVAQTKGYSFSFVLLGGYGGASTDTQTHHDTAGSTPQR